MQDRTNHNKRFRLPHLLTEQSYKNITSLSITKAVNISTELPKIQSSICHTHTPKFLINPLEHKPIKRKPKPKQKKKEIPLSQIQAKNEYQIVKKKYTQILKNLNMSRMIQQSKLEIEKKYGVFVLENIYR